MDAEEHKRRIGAILEARPWEKSKIAQKKAERELKAMARKKKKPPDRPFEWDEQKEVCKWLTKNNVSFFAPSAEAGGKDVDPIRMNQFKAIGMRSGVPDLILLDLAADGRPVALEMKRTKLTDSSLTPAQRKWKKVFPEKGWHHLVGFGHKDAIAKLLGVGIAK